MLVWIDLANSPHVPLAEAIVPALEAEGDTAVLTVRDHAQTLELARAAWPDAVVIGGSSPAGRTAKARAIARRALALHRFASSSTPDVAFSHGSYAQLVAARSAGIPAVTMMDYEHQPANHLSFRAANRVVVPAAFPDAALRRFGARPAKTRRYYGFKEELYLAGFKPDAAVLAELELDARRVIVVLRPPPEGALYHRMANDRFEEVLRLALADDDVQVVVLPRTSSQAERYARLSRDIRIPLHAVDGRSLLALADVTVGAGGTMNRESALLGTPTYTVFAGRLAAVDAELIRCGLLRDLRNSGQRVVFEKKRPTAAAASPNADQIVAEIRAALRSAAMSSPGFRRRLRWRRRLS